MKVGGVVVAILHTHTFASDLLHGWKTSDEQTGIAAEFGLSFLFFLSLEYQAFGLMLIQASL